MTGRVLGDSDGKSVGRQLQEECWERVTGRVLETVTGRVLGDGDRKRLRLVRDNDRKSVRRQ